MTYGVSDGRCRHCETPYEGEQVDDCCPGREAEMLRAEVDQLLGDLRTCRDTLRDAGITVSA